MSVTVYAPEGTLTAKRLRVAITSTPWTADETGKELSGTVAAANAAIQIQCALENFGTSTTINTQSRRKLCNDENQERIASRTRALEPLVIVGDKDDEAAVLAILTEDARVGIIARPYVDHTEDFASTDKPIWLFNATVSAVDPVTITTTDGEEFSYNVQFADVVRDIDGTLTTTP